jgi:hypothetical protein
MTKKRKRRQRPSPDRVLAGGTEAGPHQLIDLIHRLNPTGLDLGAADKEERYRKKRELQSRLVLGFGDELRVEADPQRPSLVILRYRGRDACHAVLSDLEPEARARVQRRLDEQQAEVGNTTDSRAGAESGAEVPAKHAETAPSSNDGSGAAEPRDTTGLSADELVALGTEALERYDYEAAQRLYRQACERTGADPAAAVAYLGFLVDTLGDDRAALEAGSTLSATLGSNPEIRLLLGSAAARSGRDRAAERYLGRLSGPRAGEICRTLCAHALAADDPLRTERWIQEARQRDAEGEAELRALSEQLAALRQRLRRPQEEALRRLIDGGNPEAALEQARACLEQWPDSRVARAVIDKVEARQKRQRMEARLADARQALDRGSYAQAVSGFEQALALGCPAREVNDELEHARRMLEQARDHAKLSRLRERLAGGDREPALLDYLDSPPGVRASARAELRIPVLDWLEALGAPMSGARARAAVAAVAAMERAALALAQGKPEQAEGLLQPHARVLEGFPPAQSLWQDIHARRAEQRRAAAWKAVAQAGKALEEGRTELALDRLGSIRQEALSGPERAQYADLLQRAQRQAHKDGLRKRLATLSAQANLLEAHTLLEQLIDLAEGEEQAALRARRQALEERIDRRWPVPAALSPDPMHLLLLIDRRSSRGESRAWLLCDDDGPGRGARPPSMSTAGSEKHGLVVVASLRRRLLVALLDPAAEAVVRWVVLEPPEPLVGPVDLAVRGRHAAIVDSEGRLLQIALDGWHIEQWLNLGPYFPAAEGIEQVYYAPDERFCWVRTTDPELRLHLHLLDLARRRLRHSVHTPNLFFVTDVAGRPGQLLHSNDDYGPRLYGKGGKHLCDYASLRYHQVVGAAALSSRTMVVLSFDATGEAGMPLIVSLVDRDRGTMATHRIPDSNGELVSELAVLQAPALVFVLYHATFSESTLLALRCTASALEPLYQVQVYGAAGLLRDESGHRVSLLTQTVEDGPRVTPLGETAPRFRPGTAPDRAGIPAFSPPFFLCGGPVFSLPEAEDAARYPLPQGDTDLLQWASEQRVIHSINETGRPANEQARLVAALQAARRFDVLERLIREAAREHDGDFAIVYATLMLRAGDWSKVRTALEPIAESLHEWEDLDEAGRRHIHHLLGIAQYRDHLPEQAIATWRRAQALEGGCDLEACIDLATYVGHGPDPATPMEQRPLVHRLMAGIEAADESLQAGDPDSAVQHLDHPELWAVKEVQSLARLVYALLERDAATPRDDFLRAAAIACFLDFTDPWRIPMSKRLAFPGEWEQARIDALVQRGKDWLARKFARRVGEQG